MRQISPRELADRLNDAGGDKPLLLDVREPWEFGICHIDGSVPMPMGSVPARYTELDRNAEIVVVCHHGGRSAQVCMFLEHQGFGNVINLAGGVAGWAAQVDPKMPQY
ncbi:MAG: rhodanese-like domain-containing protein [Thauera propionica]|jgi:rhodanese-related sulfurtransferase|uniref:rhodanese-like domain-containing protein n=1 Tax=Thauera TaxID=33057 RepID=UPI0023F4E113|nr:MULTISPECIES: rhodanese-like domain-containing protein [Thauera]MDD3674172.1 rhodanese-like domain-containing protein [Thauera propionica]MDY0047333.1 rhodanese-like domain-containing protein [Thauera propionica]